MEKKYLIDYLPIAEQDVTEIFDYISNDDPSPALNMPKRNMIVKASFISMAPPP